MGFAWVRHRLAARAAGLPRPTRSDWIFALRTTSAGLIALLAAYALNLDHPQWAMMTVFIVAQPVAGMVLAKGFFRLLGTLAGAVAAIGLTALLGTDPWLFVTALALWIGLCTYVSSLLRNPEAYGAALAGYTATIIALPAFGHPHLVLELATARCGEIVIGIACAGLASRLLLPQLARDAMHSRLERCILDLAAYAGGAFGGDAAGLDLQYRKLVAETQALGEMRTYARLEAPSMATRAHPLRRTIGYLLSALSAARVLHTYTAPQNLALMPVRRELKTVVDEMAAAPSLDDIRPWVAKFDAVSGHAAQTATEHADSVDTLTRVTIAGEFAEAMNQVLRGLDALRAPPSGHADSRRQPALVIHRDRHAAWRNALRAAIATMLVAAFWLATKWSEAAGIVIIVAVVASLFAPRPSPVEIAWGFFKGTLLALPFAYLVGQIALPALPGFGWFIVFVVPILVPAALAMANPRLVGVATAFAINFLAFLSPHQVMTYNPAEFFGSSASILVGILLAIGVYLVVLPADPWATANRIARAMRQDLARLCLHERIPRRSAFESLAYDRINQLMPLVRRLGRRGEAFLGGGIAAVTLGLEILRLRNLQRAPATPADVSQKITDFLAGLTRDLLGGHPAKSWAAAIAAIRHEAAALAAAGNNANALNVAVSLRIIAAAIENYPEFFEGRA
ncbi:MAG: FUSC family protein [Mesorhizobium sp.]